MQLTPEVIDGSTLGQRALATIFFPIGVEGQADSAGTASVGQLLLISRQSEANTYFGPASILAKLVNYLLDRAVGPVWAVASAKGANPTLVQRKAAWQSLEANRDVRIRLTDSTVLADETALGESCQFANLLNNKQVAFVGMPAGSAKADFLTSATAIKAGLGAGDRIVLVAPSLYDQSGVLQSGRYAAASAAAMVAMNADISDDLDTAVVPKITGIEKDSLGNDLFREIVVAGVVQNDFEDLLQGGVSPFMPNPAGSGVSISHLRMVYTVNSTMDALMTRLIMDQLFVLVRDYAVSHNALRKGNTPETRAELASGIDALLNNLKDIVQPVELGDGSTGYGVTVTSSVDERQQIISYEGEIVRGTQTILVGANLVIAV